MTSLSPMAAFGAEVTAKSGASRVCVAPTAPSDTSARTAGGCISYFANNTKSEALGKDAGDFVMKEAPASLR